MTLEEAKKNIQERMNLLLKRYREWNDAHPEWFASGELIGQVEGLEEAMGILDEVDDEPVVKDKMTLTELAKKLRKVFGFDVLTYSVYEDNYYKNQKDEVVLWARISYIKLPEYDKEWGTWLGDVNTLALIKISNIGVRIEEILDLSEYADADGNIDYSRCIVEVE